MKILIADDDFVSRMLLQELLRGFGMCHVAVNGKEAVEAVRLAHDSFDRYALVLLDIQMPEMDGHQALREIRALERARGIVSCRARIVMTSALGDEANVAGAIKETCDGFLVKPIRKAKLLEELRKLTLIS